MVFPVLRACSVSTFFHKSIIQNTIVLFPNFQHPARILSSWTFHTSRIVTNHKVLYPQLKMYSAILHTTHALPLWDVSEIRYLHRKHCTTDQSTYSTQTFHYGPLKSPLKLFASNYSHFHILIMTCSNCVVDATGSSAENCWDHISKPYLLSH